MNTGFLLIAGNHSKCTTGLLRLGRHQWRTVADRFWRPHSYKDARDWFQSSENRDKPKYILSRGPLMGNLTDTEAVEFLKIFAGPFYYNKSSKDQKLPPKVQCGLYSWGSIPVFQSHRSAWLMLILSVPIQDSC